MNTLRKGEEQAVQNKKTVLETVHQSFNQEWVKMKKIVIKEVSEEVSKRESPLPSGRVDNS